MKEKWLAWGKLKQKVRILNRIIRQAAVMLGERFVPNIEIMTAFDVFIMKEVVKKPASVYIGIESDGTVVFPVFVVLLRAEPPQRYKKMKIQQERTVVYAFTLDEYEFYERELDNIKEILMKQLRRSGHPRAWILRHRLEIWWNRIHD